MNITEQIIDNLESIGYKGKVDTIVEYFIDQNIKGILGASLMSPNDFSLSIESDSIDLKSIFSEGHNIISVSHDDAQGTTIIKCDRVEKNEITRVFDITVSQLAIENRFVGKDGVQMKYTYDKANVIFDLEISHEDQDQQVLDYKAALTPIYSKTGNTDWFSYTRKCPPVIKEKSFLKRVVDELSNRGCSRQIVTCSDGTIGYEEFPNNIFGALIQDAEKISQTKEQNDRQRIRN